jgi:hypothetical protein
MFSLKMIILIILTCLFPVLTIHLGASRIRASLFQTGCRSRVRDGNAIVGRKDNDLSSHLAVAVVAKGFQLRRVDHCVADSRKGRCHEEERAENKRREGHLTNPCVLEIM